MKTLQRTRSTVRNQRITVTAGLLSGSLMFGLFRYIMPLQKHELPKYSIFFGSMTHWPHFVRSFALLDWAVTCLGIGVVFYLLFATMDGLEPNSQTTGFYSWAMLLLGVFVGAGGFCAAAIAVMEGWYSGIEGFGVAGAGACVLIAVISACYAVINKLFTSLAKGWVVLREQPFMRPLVKIGKFLNADDVPK